MSYKTYIYGRRDSKKPDIEYIFDIGDHLYDGKWHYNVIQRDYIFHNELIEELTEDKVISEIKSKIEEIFNGAKVRDFIASPILRLYYDDENKKPVIHFK